MLDEITKKEIPKLPENQNVQQQEKQVPQTPEVFLEDIPG
jgi:hypothetical protein